MRSDFGLSKGKEIQTKKIMSHYLDSDARGACVVILALVKAKRFRLKNDESLP
jgi:hypothetical protein